MEIMVDKIIEHFRSLRVTAVPFTILAIVIDLLGDGYITEFTGGAIAMTWILVLFRQVPVLKPFDTKKAPIRED